MFKHYRDQISKINNNTRLYFTNTFFVGISFGINQLLFNYYLLGLNYSQSFIGSLISISSLSALLSSFPASFFINKISIKYSFIISYILLSVCTLIYLLFPSQLILWSMHVISGIATSLFVVASRPFLFENSTENNRPFLFSLDHAIFMASSIIGSYGGGILPTLFAKIFNTTQTTSKAYLFSLLISVLILIISIVPIIFLQPLKCKSLKPSSKTEISSQDFFTFLKLLSPTLIVSIGAGLLMPFINIFYRIKYAQPDFIIGRMLALGSLAMGLGFLLSPVFANYLGKLKLVIITQGMSIPFLLIMGLTSSFNISSYSYYVRLCLMNMSLPIYEVLLMEKIDRKKRTAFSGLLNMTHHIGWTISPLISGYIQEKSGFSVIFISTSVLYLISIILNWLIFKKSK